MDRLNELIKGWLWKRLLRVIDLVYKSLKLEGVSISSNIFLLVSQSDIFKSVNLSEHPEKVILVLTSSLNLELL